MFAFRVLVFVLLAFFVFFAHSVWTQSITAVNSQPASVSPVVVTNGWIINRFVLNDLGTVVFSSGQTAASDGLVLVRSNQFIKFVAAGDPVPGTAGKIFMAFSAGNNPTGAISLNDRDEVAFTAGFAQCPNVAAFYTTSCGASWEMGVFLYSGGAISEIAVTAYVTGVWLNNSGEILFADTGSFFVYSHGQLTKFVPPAGTLSYSTVVFNDAGVITLADPNLGMFHSSGTTFIRDLGPGDPGPDGVTIGGMWPVAANGEGDIAFVMCIGGCGLQSLQQSIFLRRRDGTIVRIMTDGDPSPLGGTFNLTYTAYNRGGPYLASVLVPPQINKSGSVVFAAPVKGGTAAGGIFLYNADGLTVIAANGDSGPPQTNANFVFFSTPPNSAPTSTVGYAINDFDTVTIHSSLSNGSRGVFQRVGDSTRKLLTLGDAVPGSPGSSFATNSDFSPLLQNDRGDVAFFADICCGSLPPEGLFFSPAPAIQVVNGDFELPGGNGLPANWQTVWSNSGSGEAFRYDSNGADSMRGTSVLRLHLDPGGGSIFVLSDPMPVSGDTVYTVSSWMRYNLVSPNDAVFFTVLQFDASGNVVGFNEVTGVPIENFWQWKPKRLLIHSAPTAASVEIRYGLMSAGEGYLDVDAVQ